MIPQSRTLRACFLALCAVWMLYFICTLLQYRANFRLSQLIVFLEEGTYQPIENGIEMRGAVNANSNSNSSDQQSCTVLYRLRATDEELQLFDLVRKDQIILGTLMMRLCQCVCSSQLRTRPLPPLRRGLRACKVPATFMVEAFRGAHVVVDGDGGWFYAWLVGYQRAYGRVSSHFSQERMYGLPEGVYLKTILTGVTAANDSWFQFEGANWSPLQNPLDSLLHAAHWVRYKATGRQVGPLGTSAHTDRNPLHVPFDGCVRGG